MDLIDRQAAIAVADSSDYVGLSVDDVKKVTDEVIKGLRQLPSAQPGEDIRAMCGECDAWNQYKNYPQPEWVPCSERLPDQPDIYMVTNSKGDVVRFVFTGTESSREYWRRCAKAWMPLPPPYREMRQDG